MKSIKFDSYCIIDEDGEFEREATISVEADYTPGSHGTWYKRNGDPGDPPEPPECEITSIIVKEKDQPDREIFFKDLSDFDQERLVEEAIEKGEELKYDI